jgi:hypothetical protein
MPYSEDAIEVVVLIHDGEIAWKDIRATVSVLGWDPRRALMAHNEIAPLVDEGTGHLNRDGLGMLRDHLETKKSLGVTSLSGLASMDVRRSILAMLKQGKFAKPFEEGRFAYFSIVGTADWEDYANVVLQMVQADTLLNIEEQLADLLERLPRADDGRSSPT